VHGLEAIFQELVGEDRPAASFMVEPRDPRRCEPLASRAVSALARASAFAAEPVEFQLVFRDGKAQGPRGSFRPKTRSSFVLKFPDRTAAGADQVVVRPIGRVGIKRA